MKGTARGAAAALAILFSFACSRMSEPKNLDPDSREFFSKVRYIITKEERAAFLRLAPGDRPRFMEEFWASRDPTPETGTNEYKNAYYARIEDANRIFKEGSTPGWLQDRGRIYITLGPPDNRETYPRGIDFYDKPEEIWWYGNFPVVFIDENWSGNYRLTPLGAEHIAEITKAQRDEKQRFNKGGAGAEAGPSIDFEIRAEKIDGKAVFFMKIPYRNIWLKAEGAVFKTTIEVRLEARNKYGAAVWETGKSYEIAMSRAEQLKNFDGDYEIRIDSEIVPGSYKVTVEVSNKTGKSRSKRTYNVEI